MNNLTVLSKLAPKAEIQLVDQAQLNIAKGVTMLGLFLASMVFGLIPFKLAKLYKWTDPNKDARTNLVVATLLSFGGGVLLCTTFMHLLPEIDHYIGDLQAKEIIPDWHFSLANFLMGCGFFIIYFVEESVHWYLNRRQKQLNKTEISFERGHSPRESLRTANSHLQKNGGVMAGVESPTKTVSTVDLVENTDHNDHSHQSHHHNYHQNHSHNHSHLPQITITDSDDDIVVSSIRGLLIVLALSVHELFEGLAVGLQSTPNSVWYMFGAVAAHKLVIAFCIGVELMVTRTRTALALMYIFVFAIVSPMGIGIGMLLSNSGGSSGFDVASVILQGLASGTLLYVIFFEILSKHKSGFIQYLAVLVGYFLMFGLKLLGGEHEHGGSESDEVDNGHGHSHNH